MIIHKAIELLLLDLDDPGSVPIEDLNDAQHLGIEALKRVLDVRRFPDATNWQPLPEETHD